MTDTTDQNKEIRCWVVTEGIAGTENQCIGVAEAMGLKPIVKRIRLREPWKTLSPFLRLETWWAFNPLLYRPWPDLLIAGGRKSIAASRYIRKMSGGQTFTVQLQDPRIDPDNFDLVAVPAHDTLRGKNVIVTTATPNRITPQKLQAARIAFAERLKPLPRPRVAVLIGGNSKTHTMTEKAVDTLIAQLQGLSAGLMVTVSRRTPEPFRQKLAAALRGDHIYFWDGQGENPYFAFLAEADFIIVTNDSASMISEAATTGKPVYTVPLEGGSEKFDAFYNTLVQRGALRVFAGTLEKWDYAPLQDAQKIAEIIKVRMNERFRAAPPPQERPKKYIKKEKPQKRKKTIKSKKK